MRQDPQNPYFSYLVPASAGSGKTYQLSKRFLSLVAAGAAPRDILTLTFTRKAAGEMRERILGEAASLLGDADQREAFDQDLKRFYQDALSSERYQPTNLMPPIPALSVAKAILDHSQLLRITTIDSIFSEWIRKFPYEAAPSAGRARMFRPSFEIGSSFQLSTYQEKAWDRLVLETYDPKLWQEADIPLSLIDCKTQVMSLDRLRTFLWLMAQESKATEGQEHTNLKNLAGLRAHSLQNHPTADEPCMTIASLLSALEHEFAPIIQSLAPEKQAPLQEALMQGHIHLLIEHRLLTKTWQISGSLIRGKKRAQLEPHIQTIDNALRNHLNAKRLKSLNTIGERLFLMAQSFNKHLELLKVADDTCDFSDLAFGCYRLFKNEDSWGARYMIQRSIRHLMLDEFQDTSGLQWAIFDTICHELLSGEGIDELHGQSGLHPSVFIVGDQKQSIYGFREADPSIITDIKQPMTEAFGVHEIPMNDSFRSAQVILDFVNDVFQPLWPTFIKHSTKVLSDTAVVPAIGSIVISPELEDDDPASIEAAYLADLIADRLTHHTLYPVWDKSAKRLRPLTYKDIGVLYRAGTHAAIFAEALRKKGIPVLLEEGAHFCRRPEILDMLALLKLLVTPKDQTALATIAKSPIFRVKDEALFRSLSTKKSPREVLPKEFFNWLEKSKKLLPHEAITNFIQVFDVLERYEVHCTQDEAPLAIANLNLFIERLIAFEDQGSLTPLAMLRTFKEHESDDSLTEAKTEQNAITLMTIHKSKGLEFNMVALVGCQDSWTKRDHYWCKSNNPLGVFYMGKKDQMPVDHHAFQSIFTKFDDEAERESERLLYVALTRARHHLIVVGSKKSRQKSTEPGGFFAFMRDQALAQTPTRYEALSSGEIVRYVMTDEAQALISCATNDTSQSVFVIRKQHSTAYAPQSPLEAPRNGLITLAPHSLLHRQLDEEAETKPAAPKKRPTLRQVKAREAGLFIHKGFESFFRAQPFDSEATFQSLFAATSSDEASQTLKEELEAEVKRGISDPQLIALKSAFPIIKPEQEVLAIVGNTMVRGTIDLLLRDQARGLAVIDFKSTTEVASQMTQEDLLLFSKDHQYDAQLSLYKKALTSTHGPTTPISCGIYFTHINRLIWTTINPMHHSHASRAFKITLPEADSN